jgi:uncharacterized protein YcgI (DUF1989 family)
VGGKVIVLRAGQGRALKVRQGDELRIVNLGGGQVVALWALNAADPGERMSMEHTRVALGRLVPKVGDGLYSSRRRELLTLIEDTSPGAHDTLIAACDPERYRQLGGSHDHPSCVANFRAALTERELNGDLVPSPLNLFMNIPWRGDGALEFAPSLARVGDRVTFVAELDVIVVLSVCPMDLTPVNPGRRGDIGVTVLSAS